MNPSANCIRPAMKTAVKNTSKAPKSVIAVSTIAVKPAAGPETLMWDLLK